MCDPPPFFDCAMVLFDLGRGVKVGFSKWDNEVNEFSEVINRFPTHAQEAVHTTRTCVCRPRAADVHDRTGRVYISYPEHAQRRRSETRQRGGGREEDG